MYKPHQVETDINNPLNAFCVFKCPLCGSYEAVTVSKVAFDSYYNEGRLVQNALPELSADQRELFVSGICPKCWEETFGE